MGTKVYVGNLPFSVTDEDLRAMFSNFGEITEAVLIKDKFSGRSKGFGFVTYSTEESANKAISEMNGKEVQGRELKVTEAAPAVKGDTAQGAYKQVTLETGVTVMTPLFIKENDMVRVNTETGEYTERVS